VTSNPWSSKSARLRAYSSDSSLSSVASPKSVKLSVITQFFPPDFAATGQLIEELVRHLGQQGMAVEVFTGQPSYAFKSAAAPAQEKFQRVHIKRSHSVRLFSQRVRSKAINGVLFYLRAALYILTHGWRHQVLLLTTAPPFLPILGYLANLLFGMSYICLLYDLYPDIIIRLGVIPYHHWIARAWQAVNCWVWRRSKAIIVLSPAMKQRIVDLCPEVTDKVSVIHSWADPEQILPIPKEDNWFAQEHQLVKKFTVLYSGNMGRCHDTATLLETVSVLQDEPIQFVFIGGGARRKDFVKEVERRGLTNCLFLPYQDQSVLPYSLTACNLALVSVSAGMEDVVAPSKLYSALAAGRPIAVVCPSHSYLKPLIADADCGATFSNGDGVGLAKFIRLLSQDPELAATMGNAGRRYMQKNFTPTVIAKQYFRVLQDAAM
jgi:glycosyltransferase involved in cell wall biosynthesis